MIVSAFAHGQMLSFALAANGDGWHAATNNQILVTRCHEQV